MNMPPTRRSIVLVCVAVLVFAALVPMISLELSAVLTPLWFVVPAVTIVLIRRRALCSEEQLVGLLSLPPSRAPPSSW
jgi:hypothetical protein